MTTLLRWCWLVLSLGISLPGAWGAAPPASLTPKQRDLLRQSDRLFAQADAFDEQGKVTEATAAIRQGLALERQVFGQVRATRCDKLSVLGELLERQQEWAEARRVREEALFVLTRAMGENHWQVIDARWSLRDCKRFAEMTEARLRRLDLASEEYERASKLRGEGKARESLKPALQAAAIRKELLGEQHPHHARSLENLALSYQDLKEYKTALPLFDQALRITRAALGDRHPEHGNRLNSLASCHEWNGDGQRAVMLYRQALSVHRLTVGAKHPEYAITLNYLARALRDGGEAKAALPLFQEVVAIRREILGEKHAWHIENLDELARLYMDLGDMKSAVPLFHDLIRLRQETRGKNHLETGQAVNSLANAYHGLGETARALPLYQRAVEIHRDALGGKHAGYAAVLNNLARAYRDLGKLGAAERLFLEVLAIRKLSPGERSSEYLESLGDLGWLHRNRGDFASALPLFQKAAAVTREMFGESHAAHLAALRDLYQLHMLRKDKAMAESVLERAVLLTSGEKLLRTPDHAGDLQSLADLYVAHSPGVSIALLERALDVRRELQGEMHIDYANCLAQLGLVHWIKLDDHRSYGKVMAQLVRILDQHGEHPPPALLPLLNQAASYLANAQSFPEVALRLAGRAVIISRTSHGEKSPEYADHVICHARVHQLQGKFREALPLFERSVEILKVSRGVAHPAYLASLRDLAEHHSMAGDFASALAVHEKVLEGRRQAVGAKHPDYVASLKDLAKVHIRMGEAARALPLLARALEAEKELHAGSPRQLGLRLCSLADIHLEAKEYRMALDLSEKALLLLKESRGPNPSAYVQALGQLAAAREGMGDDAAALPLRKEALQLMRGAFGDGYRVISELEPLASLHSRLGNHLEAVSLAKDATEIARNHLGESHVLFAGHLRFLADVYEKMGDVQYALPLRQRVVAILRETAGEVTLFHARELHRLAELHCKRGDLGRALPIQERATEIFRRTCGEKSSEYVWSLIDLVRLKMSGGPREHAEAQPLITRALELLGAGENANTLPYADATLGLFESMSLLVERPVVEARLRQIARLYAEKAGKTHRGYERAIRIDADLRFSSAADPAGELAACLKALQEIVDIRGRTGGEKSQSVSYTLAGMARFCIGAKDYKQAAFFSERAVEIARYNFQLASAAQSERQQFLTSREAMGYLAERLSIPDVPEYGPEQSYSHALALKGAVFTLQRERRLLDRLVDQDRQAAVRELAGRLQEASRQLAALTLQGGATAPAPERRERIEKLIRDKEDLETRLSRLSAEHRAASRRRLTTPSDLRDGLPPGAALVDFHFYDHFGYATVDARRYRKWQRRLTAFIVRRGEPVARVGLGPAGPIEDAIHAWRQSPGRRAGGETSPGDVLRKILWLPLEGRLAGATTVLISPDGALGQLSFAALPGKRRDRYLIEEVALAVVPVPQLLPELLSPPANADRPAAQSMLLVGGVDFDRASAAASPAGHHRGPGRGSLREWSPLPGTKAEIDEIAAAFTSRVAEARLTRLTGPSAGKSSVRGALGRHRYLHLATHGYFAPAESRSALAAVDREDSGFFGEEGVTGWHPLLLSGIVLAGANREPKANEEDGVLTAMEVSELDLSQTDLAVLSACETGLGRVAGGEGLLGLQRAFAVAGARGVVASLWQVPDAATKELMVRFYANLLDGKTSRLEALRQAQLWMLRDGKRHPGLARGMEFKGDKLDENDPRLPPYYWAAFVLSGDWR